jgi:hypothetical protein
VPEQVVGVTGERPDHAGTSVELIAALARLARIAPRPEDHATLASLLDAHLGSMESLAQLELGEADPIAAFDPRWA